ncbi:MAG: hydantoinase B/oxoprolinase family protein [Minwuiales bacterium]|nr:hydantoinase B/oxoprolinase family protein [Minwuiales bacterium]
MARPNPQTEIDPITLEILRNRIDAITEEMQLTLLRSAVSVILKEGEDCSSGLFDACGDLIGQACANPLHLGVMGPAVKAILDRFPADRMQQGDVYLVNDPYTGGTHLPDLIMAVPVFAGDALIAFSVALAHHEDVGGKTQGSMPADATEVFQEGIIIPPAQLYSAGEPNRTLFDLLERNVRLPGVLFGDLDAELACAKIGARGVDRMVAEFGVDTVLTAIAALSNLAERRTRQKLAEIPDGSYSFRDLVDSDGIDIDKRLEIACTVTVAGSDVTVDFAGSSPQAPGPANIGYWGTASAAFYVIRAVTDPDIPSNQGAMRPVTVRVPEGNFLNPRHPAPVCIRAHTGKRVADAVLGAFAKAAPDRVAAPGSGSLSVCSFGGAGEDGTPFGATDLVAGGTGGRPDKDGIDLLDTDVTNCQNVPVEALEARYPLRVLTTRYRTDSGGAGTFRGGLGLERTYQVTRGPVRCCFRSERHDTDPWGLAGGSAGARYASRILRADGSVEPLPSKAIFELRTGDVLEFLTGGGGGYGDPLTRDPDLVLGDVQQGKVSAAAANETYGVVIEGDVVDRDATSSLRARLAAARGPITWTFDLGSAGVI